MELSRYIVLNPVRAKMAEHAEDWPWSTYRATAGDGPIPAWLKVDWLLSQFGKQRNRAMQKYAEFIAAGIGKQIWPELRQQVYLGSDAFIAQVNQMLEQDTDFSEIPRVQWEAPSKPLAEYDRTCANIRQAMAKAYAEGGYTLNEIARHFGVHYSTVSRPVKRFEEKQDITNNART